MRQILSIYLSRSKLWSQVSTQVCLWEGAGPFAVHALIGRTLRAEGDRRPNHTGSAQAGETVRCPRRSRALWPSFEASGCGRGLGKLVSWSVSRVRKPIMGRVLETLNSGPTYTNWRPHFESDLLSTFRKLVPHHHLLPDRPPSLSFSRRSQISR